MKSAQITSGGFLLKAIQIGSVSDPDPDPGG
jgi:hypothetical protein